MAIDPKQQNKILKESERIQQRINESQSESEKSILRILRERAKLLELDKKVNEELVIYNRAKEQGDTKALEASKSRIDGWKKEKSVIKEYLGSLDDVNTGFNDLGKKIEKISSKSLQSLNFDDRKAKSYSNAIGKIGETADSFGGSDRARDIFKEIVELGIDSNDISTKKQLLTYDEADALQDLEDLEEKLITLAEEDRDIAQETLDLVRKRADAVKEDIKNTGKLTKEAKAQDKAREVFNKKYDEFNDKVEETVLFAKAFTKEISKDPTKLLKLALVAFTLGLAKALKSFAEDVKKVTQDVGTSLSQSLKIVRKDIGVLDNLIQKTFLGVDQTTAINPLVQQFGTLRAENNKFIKDIAQGSVLLGVQAEHAAFALRQFQVTGGVSTENLETQMSITRQLAEQNNIPIGRLFADLAENSEDIASFGGDNLSNMKRAAIEARKMGVNLSTTAKIANSLLDFESSIQSEMEASLMIGKQLNFNRARQLALEGDVAGAARDVVNQLGGQAEFTKLNVLQRRKLAQALGVSVEELSKLASGKLEVGMDDSQVDPTLPYITRMEKSLGVIQHLLDSMLGNIGLIVGALFFLTKGRGLLKGLGMGKFFKSGFGKMGKLFGVGKGANLVAKSNPKLLQMYRKTGMSFRGGTMAQFLKERSIQQSMKPGLFARGGNMFKGILGKTGNMFKGLQRSIQQSMKPGLFAKTGNMFKGLQRSIQQSMKPGLFAKVGNMFKGLQRSIQQSMKPGLFAKVGNMFKGILGKGKGMLGRGLGMFRGVNPGALIGTAAAFGTDKLRDSKLVTPGSGADKSLGMLGETAKYAGIGATLGSFVPVVGTALGAGAGSALGGTIGLYKEFFGKNKDRGKTLTSSSTEAQKASETATVIADKLTVTLNEQFSSQIQTLESQVSQLEKTNVTNQAILDAILKGNVDRRNMADNG